MQELPFEVRKELPGWQLFWAELEVSTGTESHLPSVLREVASRARAGLQLEQLSSVPAPAALRRLFKACGCDPTRYRPASEALLRRILKGEELPSIHPLVDINNCLSAELAVPCCVMAEGTFVPPLVWRAGKPGESYESLKGPFNLEGKPLLLDTIGPLDAPITGSRRVKIIPETRRAWLVAYLPEGVVDPVLAKSTLNRLAEAVSVVRVLRCAAV